MENLMTSVYLTARSCNCLEKIGKIINEEHPQVVMAVTIQLMGDALASYDKDDWDGLMELNKIFIIKYAERRIKEKEGG